MKSSSQAAASANTTELAPGTMIASKFRVERVVGRGGMGIVVAALNVQLDQRVALKLLATRTEDTASVERFGREARAAARLRSEHVARVFDVGQDSVFGPFIVMELLEGQTLAELVATSGRVAPHRAIELVIEACEGLAEAHARGIVHQDVKPANLFLVTGHDGRPKIKLLDFGIATVRAKGRDGDTTSSQSNTGTPAYLAPEQLRGASAIDHRADIWALGCVLYEILIAERAFAATRFTELVTQILEASPPAFPPDLDVDPAITIIVDRCLAKDPAKRFASTGELALALLPFARRRSHAAVARAVSHVKAVGLDPHLEMPSSMPPRPSDPEIEVPPQSGLRAPLVPKFSKAPDFAPLLPLHQRESLPALHGETTRRRRGLWLLLAAALLLALIAVGWSRTREATSPKAADPSPIATSAPQPSLGVARVATTNAPAAPPPDASDAVPAVPPPRPMRVVPQATRPAPAATHSTPDSEIRMTR